MTATISIDGLVEIPRDFREADKIKPGQQCEIERLGKGEYRLKLKEEPEGKPRMSLLAWLLACPEKDWMTEPDRSEKTTLERPTLFDE